MDRRRFLVVTPTFNAAQFIDDAIISVVTQNAPNANVHYHVQDGGSTDATLAKLCAWQKRLDTGLFPHQLAQLSFSYAVQPDAGMYDALRKAFIGFSPEDEDILTWINGDDRLAPGAFATVSQVFEDVAGCEFLSGRIALLNEAGAVVALNPGIPYARADLADGLHDGRTLSFIMQEGTFFSGRSWNAVGGVDASFRLAGDWDLWRRLASVVDHFLVDALTGFHRRREGQLSGNIDDYYGEIDARPQADCTIATACARAARLVRYDMDARRWITTSYDTSLLSAPALLLDGRSVRSATCRPGAGFSPVEGPYPEYGLPGGIRWINSTRAEVKIQAPVAGRYRIRLTIRAAEKGLVLDVGVDARAPYPIMLDDPAPLVDQVVETIWWLADGANRLILDCGCQAMQRPLLLVACEATETDLLAGGLVAPMATREAGRERSGMAIVILCPDREPELLDRSLCACAPAMRAGAAVFVAMPRYDILLEQVVAAWRGWVAGCFALDGPLFADRETIRIALFGGTFREVIIIKRGDLLVEEGIDAASAALDASGAETAECLIEVRDSAGRARQHVLERDHGPAFMRPPGASGIGERTLQVGCAAVQRTQRVGDVAPGSRAWILDDESPVMGLTAGLLLAAALTLLGYDARYAAFSERRPLLPPPGEPIIAAPTCATKAGACATIALRSGTLQIATVDAPEEGLVLPLAADTDRLLPRDRADARRRLGFAASKVILCIAEQSTCLADSVLDQIVAAAIGPVRIINFGAPITAVASSTADVMEMGRLDDLNLISYLLSAADAALSSTRRPSLIAIAAWSCGVPVMDGEGISFAPCGSKQVLGSTLAAALNSLAGDGSLRRKLNERARAHVRGTRSLLALALELGKQQAVLQRITGLEPVSAEPLVLKGGTVTVRSTLAKLGRPFLGQAKGVLLPLRGCALLNKPQIRGGLSVSAFAAEAIICLEEDGGTELRLHLRGMPNARWAIEAGGKSFPFVIDGAGDRVLRLPLAMCAGPTHCRFEAKADGCPPQPLQLTGWEVIGDAVGVTSHKEGAVVRIDPAGQACLHLAVDGDWQRLSGFLEQESPYPRAGLFAPFQWSTGNRSVVRMRVTGPGWRELSLALAAGTPGQRIRPVIAGRAHAWSEPLDGPIGHVEYRGWKIDWQSGDVEIQFELSEVLSTSHGDLGIILFAIELGDSGGMVDVTAARTSLMDHPSAPSMASRKWPISATASTPEGSESLSFMPV